jgi:hypothetical protein
MLENQSTGKANKDYQKASLFLKGVDSDWNSLVSRVGKCNIKAVFINNFYFFLGTNFQTLTYF